MRKVTLTLAVLIPFCALLAVFVYNLPPVYERVGTLRAELKYRLNPPEEAVFVPQEQVPLDLPTPTLTHTPPPPTPTNPGPADTPVPSPTPTMTSTPLPESAILDGVVYVDQHGRWNYCGPANLAMALNFWGWPGNRDDVAAVVKPGVADPNLDFIQRGKWDKNVMPYEMADFVTDHTDFNVVTRSGGEIELVKRLIAGGFPVLVEKGYYEADYTGKVAWLGHYLFTTGYDDLSGEFIVQDAYLKPGKNMRVDYQTFLDGWRSFNYLFMVIYPPAREADVYALLGPWADTTYANQNALRIAEEEIQTYTAIDEFFAWFNKGTSHVNLLQYNEAGLAYDRAFQVYAQLESDDTQRPYRILWYQTGPYWAYFYTGRYQDTINLANTTLYDTIAEPTLEESLYWRGQAYLALGQTGEAIADFREAVRLNPNFAPGLNMLNQLGVAP
jgi:uncharacterized protein YvpB